MSGALDALPAWGLLVLGVVALAFQFALKLEAKREAKRSEEARREYRERRSSGSDRPPKPVDDTGRHELREVLEGERERDQRHEILTNTRDHAEMMGHLIAAEARHAALLVKVVDTLEALQAQQAQAQETQREIVRYLRVATCGGDGGAPSATLRGLTRPIRPRVGEDKAAEK